MIRQYGIAILYGNPGRQFDIQPRPLGKLRLRLRAGQPAILYARHDGTTRRFYLELQLPFSCGVLIPREIGRNQTLKG